MAKNQDKRKVNGSDAYNAVRSRLMSGNRQGAQTYRDMYWNDLDDNWRSKIDQLFQSGSQTKATVTSTQQTAQSAARTTKTPTQQTTYTNHNSAHLRSGQTRDEYDSGVRQRYAQREPEMTGGELGEIVRGLNSGKVRLSVGDSEIKTLQHRYNANPTQENAAALNARAVQQKADYTDFQNYLSRYNHYYSAAGIKERTEKNNADILTAQAEREEAGRKRNEAYEHCRSSYQRGDHELSAAAATEFEYWDQQYKRLDDRIKGKTKENDDLANLYYHAENKEKQEALLEDTGMKAKYTQANDLQSDIDKLLAVASDATDHNGGPEIARYKTELAEKYGLTQEMIDNYAIGGAQHRPAGEGYTNLWQLIEDLQEQKGQAVKTLGDNGFDYDRMKGYEQTLRDAREYEADEAEWKQYASDNPVLASVESVLLAPFQGVDYLKMAASNIGHSNPKDLDTYVPANVYNMDTTNFVSTVRGQVSEDLEKSTNWELFGQNVASFLYQSGMSMADTAVQSTAFGGASIYFMGTAAASNKARDVILRGGTKEQAFWGGLAAGAAEALFEKVSIDNLLKTKSVTGWKSFLKETGKQMAIEGSEETFTEIANILADAAIMGDRSEYAAAVSEYMKEPGVTEEQAKKKAFLDCVGQVALAGAGGALSGGIMGGVSSGGSLASYGIDQFNAKNDYAAALVKNPEALNMLVGEAKQGGEKATKLAAKIEQKTASGKEVTQGEARRLLNAAVEQAAQTASGFGKFGTQAFSKFQQETGMDADSLKSRFQAAYEVGLTQVPMARANLQGNIQVAAYNAGRMDAVAAMKHDVKASKGATVWGREGGVIENEWSKGMDAKIVETLNQIGAQTGTKIMFTDKITADIEGREIDANGYLRDDGVLVISRDADNPAMVVIKHEITHRMQQLAPKEYRSFRNYAVQMMAQSGSVNTQTLVQQYQELYSTSTERAMDEIAADFTQRILTDESALQEFIGTAAQNTDNRNAVQKFFDAVREFISRIKQAFKGDKAGMDRAAMEQFGATVSQLERAEQLWKNAYKATVQAAQKASLQKGRNQSGTDTKTSENKTTTSTKTKNTARSGSAMRYQLKHVGGKQVVWVENSDLSNAELRDHSAVAAYIAQHIGEVYTIIESGQKVFIGKELPDEYTQSKYTSYLKKRNPQLLRAKNKATSDLGLLIETATNRRWEPAKHTQNKDAKYGMYRYDSSFAFPVKDTNGNTTSVRAYDVELLIRNASDGKKYLYDIVGIKENTTAAIDLQKREARLAAHKAASHGSVSTNSIPRSTQKSNRKNANSKQYSLKVSSDLMKENAKLQEVNDALRAQLKTTEFAKVDSKALEFFARQLLKDYQSRAEREDILDDLDALYTYLANGADGNSPAWEDAYDMAWTIAGHVLDEAVDVNDEYYGYYKDLSRYLRTTGITLSPEYHSDLAGYEVNPYDDQRQEAQTWLTHDLMERFFELPQAKPTFADKAERRLTEQAIKDANKLRKLREEKNAKIAAIITEEREKRQALRKQLTEEKKLAVAKTKEHYKAKAAKVSEGQKAKELRDKISRHAADLSKKFLRPTDKKHIPQELQGAVAMLLESINMESNFEWVQREDGKQHRVEKGTDPKAVATQRTQAFAELKLQYAQFAEELTIDPWLTENGGLLDQMSAMKDKPLGAMNSEELQTIWQTLRAIEASIMAANKIFSAGRWKTVHEAAESLLRDNSWKKNKTELIGGLGKIQKLASLDMMTPETFLHLLGDSGDAIFRMMRDAQDEHIRLMKEVVDFTHSVLGKLPVRQWESQTHEVVLGGEKVKLSTAQIMELHVLLRRERAQSHIFDGGILPDAVSDPKSVKKIVKAKPVRNITLQEVTKATSLLTDEQRKVAESLQKFASTTLSEYGNRASMKVYNYEKFAEKNYWPIRVNKNEVKQEIGHANAVVTISDRGFAKAMNPKATNALRLGSIFDTFASHSSEMATYSAWLGTIEDINRIRNYKFREAGQTFDTVGDIVNTVHGTNGTAYLEKLLVDITHGVKGTHGETAYTSKLLANYKAAAVGANLRVIIQQPTAILRAADMIGAQYFVGTPHTGGWQKALKYAPIAQWKDWGYFDINTGRQMKDVLFDSDNIFGKARNISMWGASKADSLSWGMLWNAVERETMHRRKDLKPETEEFYKAVAARFTEIVDHTQVVDGILQRSQIMRNSDGLSKMATSFMGEPTKQYNMLMQAAYDAQKNTSADRLKAARKQFARTAVTLTISCVVNAMAQSFMDAVRDDDKEQKYWEKWLEAFAGVGEDASFWESNLLNTINLGAYIPFVKDVLSLFQGYDVSRMDMEGIEKAVRAGINMYKALNNEGKYTIGAASANLFAEVARLVGLPVYNLKRDVKSFAMLVAIEADNYLMQYRMEKASLKMNYRTNKGVYMDILYNAYVNDPETYEIIYADMQKEDKFKTADKTTAQYIKTEMEKRMKDTQGVKDVDDLEQRYLSPAQQKKYDASVSKVQKSHVWKKATAAQRDEAEDLLYNITVENNAAESALEKIAGGVGVGLTAEEYALYRLALDVVDQPSEDSGKMGSFTQDEAEAALELLGLRDDEKNAYLWQSTHKSWKDKSNPWK